MKNLLDILLYEGLPSVGCAAIFVVGALVLSCLFGGC